MISAFLIPGFNQYRSFEHSDFDVLKETMLQHDISLAGMADTWQSYGVREYGQLASAQLEQLKNIDVLIGHSLGAIAALASIEDAGVDNLILCSPSALFAEDADILNKPETVSFIGQKRVDELLQIGTEQTTDKVNGLRIRATITYGSNEKILNPALVHRAHALSDRIASSEVLIINGAGHSIRDGIYARAIARLISGIFR